MKCSCTTKQQMVQMRLFCYYFILSSAPDDQRWCRAAALSRSLVGSRKSNQTRTVVPSYQDLVINACCSVSEVNHNNILKRASSSSLMGLELFILPGSRSMCEWDHSSFHSPQRSPHRLVSVLFSLILWLSVCVFLSLYPAEEHWWKLFRLICTYETFYLC